MLIEGYDVRKHLVDLHERLARKDNLVSGSLEPETIINRIVNQSFGLEAKVVAVLRTPPAPEQITDLRTNALRIREWLLDGGGKRGVEHYDYKFVLEDHTPKEALGYFGYAGEWVAINADRVPCLNSEIKLATQVREEDIASVDTYWDFDDVLVTEVHFDGRGPIPPIIYASGETLFSQISPDAYHLNNWYFEKIIKEIVDGDPV